MENEKFGYSLFNDVQDNSLKAFNRLQTFYNIKDDYGLNRAREYLGCLTKRELGEVVFMRTCINTYGRDAVINELKFKTEGYVEHDENPSA